MATTISNHVVLAPELILPSETGKYDRSHDVYAVMIVTPRGRLNRKNPLAVPKRWTGERPLQKHGYHYSCLSLITKEVRHYNSHANALGWKSWAVRVVDLERRDFLMSAEAASIKLGDRCSDGRFLVRGYVGFHGEPTISIDLDQISIPCAAGDDLRRVALRAMRKLLRKVEQAASAPEVKLHKPVRARGVA